VATLGTSTTPEHLKRAFRLVREIIFCFDGDKAGRAAAWRALGNALPEAEAGRELKFLFLPEGEDPDSLVGKEGKAAFEARYAGALPLSEYLVAHLTSAIDVSHADGKARFVAEARPLLERVPAGTYRELLLDRLAQAIGVSAERFMTIVGPVATPEGSTPAPQQARRASTARSAGRGGLVRQAVHTLLHFPVIAARLSAADRNGLDTVNEPGIEVLREILDALEAQPAQHAAQLLERWRDQPLGERLSRLAAEPSMLEDEQAAGDELVTATRELARAASEAELNALIAKEQQGELSAPERLRLVELLKKSRRS
jgi:DNA primase